MTQPQSYQAELVGVFGQPVAENPTGVMQEAAFRDRGLNFRYLNIEVPADRLSDAMAALRAFGMRGINLTVPHKVAVIQYLDRLSPEAELMGAVNTVVHEGDELVGYNTDGQGFLRSLQLDAHVDATGKQVVFLGAGGAARAMSVELALAKAGKITIVNRTRSRGEELAALLRDRTGIDAEFVPWLGAYHVLADADILINATSIGLFPDVDAMPAVALESFRPGLLVCDVIPNPPNTAFLKAAAACGAHTLDGLGMLVHQGAVAFKMWTGVDAPIPVMYQALAEVFGG
jgi:shikimate dehydrogenase